MPEMIPRTLDPEIENDPGKSAEVALFHEIEKDESLKDWTCLHSLNLETDKAGYCGEIDFVLVGPSGVYCLETKGGGILRREGVWISVDRNGNEHRIKDPYAQVKDATYVVKREIEKKLKDLAGKIVFGHVVAFPHCVVKQSSIECNPTLTYDRNDRGTPLSAYLKRVRAYFETKQGHEGMPITPEIRQRIKDLLRPNFEIFEPLGARLEKIERQIESLTEEQYRVFDALAENPRILVKGQAGTGKTLLARYHARNLARQGKRVLFLCFNVLLGEVLKAEFKREKLVDRINVDRLFNHIQLTIDKSNFREEFETKRLDYDKKDKGNLFFKNVYPEYFIKAAKDLGKKYEPYDYLVIDEAQDIMCGSIMSAADRALKGGLKKGTWCIFYDPDCQAEVFNNYDEQYVKSLIQECRPTIGNLTRNCRNTKQIVDETSAITGFKMAEFVTISGERVKYYFYRDGKDLHAKITEYITSLLKSDVKHEDITILYPGGFKGIEHALRDLPGIVTQPLTDENVNTPQPGTIYTCSIQKYKGLENKVIIITGLEHVRSLDNRYKAVFYVGMTRGKSQLTIFANEKTRGEIEQLRKRD